MKFILVLVLAAASSAAFAQTTGTVDPNSTPADLSGKQDVPPGGCMPIGLTASGEIVFPIQCRELIERSRATAVEKKTAPAEEKEKSAAKPPAPVEEKEKSAAKQPDVAPPEESKPAIKPVESIPLPKRVEAPIERATNPDDRYGCQRYRSYDPVSGSYMGFDGKRRPCR